MHSHSTQLHYGTESMRRAYSYDLGTAQRLLAHGCHLSVRGPNKADTTRLMRDLARASGRAGPRTGVRVYLDLSRLALSGSEEFFDVMLAALRREVTRAGLGTDLEVYPDPGTAYGSFCQLRAALCLCERSGLRVDYLFDRVEALIRNPGFDASFFGALRHLGGSGAVTFACATRIPLHELLWATPASGSPFWNLFVQLNLTPRRSGNSTPVLGCNSAC